MGSFNLMGGLCLFVFSLVLTGEKNFPMFCSYFTFDQEIQLTYVLKIRHVSIVRQPSVIMGKFVLFESLMGDTAILNNYKYVHLKT